MSDPIRLSYMFRYEDGDSHSFDVLLDEHLRLVNEESGESPPEWARLDNHKCPNCPLDSSTTPYCPASAGIAELLGHFEGRKSTDRVIVEVQVPERTYRKETDLQDGLFSLMVVIMPTSGCPAVKFLRPMARFHLPFSSLHEAEVRSVCFYLLRQYFTEEPQRDFDSYLSDLNQNYETLQTVNTCLVERIRMADASGDVSKNAVIILMVLSQMMTMELRGQLKSLDYLFEE